VLQRSIGEGRLAKRHGINSTMSSGDNKSSSGSSKKDLRDEV
jgi:hypothetical protein